MIARVRTCAVVQGNIRRGTREVVEFASNNFDCVVLSTWEGEDVAGFASKTCHVLQNRKPANPGYTSRNLQRLSSAAGISLAEQLGCTHVLKWRTDMLPIKLEVGDLLAWSGYRVPEGVSSRIVTCAFRNLTVREDWFSSIPDLFAFGDLEMMKLLWGADGFDLAKPMNVPAAMLAAVGEFAIDRPEVAGLFCAESELYAWFRAKLEERVCRPLDHPEIAKNYMYLIDHRRLGICWFDAHEGFRSIVQALQHPWWTERTWRSGVPVVSEKGYPEGGLIKRLRRKYLTPATIRMSLRQQARWYRQYTGNRHAST